MRGPITGAAGAVGSCLVSRLQTRHPLRGFDLSPMPGLRDAVIGDLADLEVVEGAVAGMEAVIHLGGFGGDRPWEEILPTNYVGTYNVFEAAITCPGIGYEVVFAVSDSNWPMYDLEHGRQVLGYRPQDRSEVPTEQWDT